MLRQRQAESGRDRQDIGSLTRDVAAISQEHRALRGPRAGASRRRRAASKRPQPAAGSPTRRSNATSKTSRRARLALTRRPCASTTTSPGSGPELEKLAQGRQRPGRRVQLIQEQVRRLAERIDKLEAIAAFPEEARELLQRATFEREQLAQRLLQIERLSGEVTDRLAEFLQSTARLDQRTQMQAAEILDDQRPAERAGPTRRRASSSASSRSSFASAAASPKRWPRRSRS